MICYKAKFFVSEFVICSLKVESTLVDICPIGQRCCKTPVDVSFPLPTPSGEISSLKVVQGNLQTNLADTTKKLQAAKEAQDKAADQAKEEVYVSKPVCVLNSGEYWLLFGTFLKDSVWCI